MTTGSAGPAWAKSWAERIKNGVNMTLVEVMAKAYRECEHEWRCDMTDGQEAEIRIRAALRAAIAHGWTDDMYEAANKHIDYPDSSVFRAYLEAVLEQDATPRND